MSLAGSRFSSESAPRPFHYWVRERGGPIFTAALLVRPMAGPSGHTISPHSSSREGHHATVRWNSRFLLFRFDLALSCCCSLLPGPAELAAVNPDAVHDDG